VRGGRPSAATPTWTAIWTAIRASLIEIGAWVIGRVPEGIAIRLAELAGRIAYRVAPERREIARRNLHRVVAWLDANDLGTPAVRRAATDVSALERLVRAAFRHHARYYLEVARTPRLTPRYIRDRLLVETPETVDEAFAASPPPIFVGLHFGAIELPGLLFSQRVGREAVAPMEELHDRRLQAWLVRTRGAMGVRIVGLREARRVLGDALAAGQAVGLVADRDLTGGGIETELFGAPAPLPAGPALLALESGAPIYVAAVRRAGIGRYRGRLERVPIPSDGTRRERVEAILAGEARVFERVIADAPEQWWAVFYPIWPDPPAAAPRPAAATATRHETR
jgi:KDO2-lipid IV(A) lauroyltransferase